MARTYVDISQQQERKLDWQSSETLRTVSIFTPRGWDQKGWKPHLEFSLSFEEAKGLRAFLNSVNLD